MNKYLKNWGFLVISDTVVQVVGFLVVLRLAKLLTPSEYGMFNLVLSLAMIFAIFSNFGMTQVITRTIAQFPELTKGFLKKILPLRALSIALSLLTSVIYFLVSKELSGYYILLSCLITLANSSWDLCESIFFGRKNTKYTSVVNIVFTVIWAICITSLPLAHFNITTIIIIYTTVYSAKSLCLLALCYGKIWAPAGDHMEKIYGQSPLSIIRECLPYLWLWGIGIFANQVPLIFLNKNSGIDDVGYYSLGFKLILPVSMVIETIFRALFPFMTQMNHEEPEKFSRLIIKLLIYIIFAGSLIAVAGNLLSFYFITEIFGATYLNAVAPFNLLIWTSVLYAIQVLTGNALSSSKRQNTMASLATADVILLIPITYISSFYGAGGLALGRLVYLAVTLFYHTIVLFKFLPQSFRIKDILYIYLYLIAVFVISYFPGLEIAHKVLMTLLLFAVTIHFNDTFRGYWHELMIFLNNFLKLKILRNNDQQ